MLQSERLQFVRGNAEHLYRSLFKRTSFLDKLLLRSTCSTALTLFPCCFCHTGMLWFIRIAQLVSSAWLKPQCGNFLFPPPFQKEMQKVTLEASWSISEGTVSMKGNPRVLRRIFVAQLRVINTSGFPSFEKGCWLRGETVWLLSSYCKMLVMMCKGRTRRLWT